MTKREKQKMRKLDFQYHMRLLFPEPVNRHHFTLRCFPIDSERQKITNLNIQITPLHVGGTEMDSFGNRCIYGVVEKSHTEFCVSVDGMAYVYGDAFQPVADAHKIGMFRYNTDLTKIGPTLDKLYKKLSAGTPEKEAITEKALRWMEAVHSCLKYVQGITQVTTTAEEAAVFGMGVCQDYAHILLALLRKEHIPSRYVVGMMTGEGASHAWVEVCDGKKWVGFDPTNNCMVDDQYICISHGRDARDCTINQGYFYGSPRQIQEINVVVEESGND